MDGGGGGTGAGVGRRDDNQDVGGPRKRVRISQPTPTAPHLHVDYLVALLRIDTVGGDDRMKCMMRCAALAAFLADPTLAAVDSGRLADRAFKAAKAACGDTLDDAEAVNQIAQCVGPLEFLMSGELEIAESQFHSRSDTADGVIQLQLNSNVCIPFASGSPQQQEDAA